MDNKPPLLDSRRPPQPLDELRQAAAHAQEHQATAETLARLQRELDRWKAGHTQFPAEGRSRLHLELERERLMRVEAELNRLEGASTLAEVAAPRALFVGGPPVDAMPRQMAEVAALDAMSRSRPGQEMQQLDSNTCRARLHALQEDFRKMEEMVSSMVQYKAKIDQLKQENASMKSSYEANLRKYCSHISRLERDNMVLRNQAKNMESQIHGKGDDRDKSKLLLERLRMVEAENSSLVLENEQQRQQYEKCLDEIANQVVQALLAQKTLREECLKLQARVHDLELQNKHLNLMFQQRMRITSNESVGNITLNFNDNGGSLHSMCSEIMGDDSPGKPQLSSPPPWLQEKMAASPANEADNLSPSSSSSCSAPSPSTPDSQQDQVMRTKIETEFPATNASPKVKHISVMERRSRSLERGSSGPLGWAHKILRGGRRRSESQEKNYMSSPRLKQSTSADALTHYGVTNKLTTSLSQTAIDTSSWRDSLSQERLCAKDAKLLLRTSSSGSGKQALSSSKVRDINHHSFEAFNRSFEKLLAKKLPDEKQKKESSKKAGKKDQEVSTNQTSAAVSTKKSETVQSEQKSKPKSSTATAASSVKSHHTSGHHQKVRPSPALRNPFADPLKSPKSPSPIPGQYYYYDYSDEDSDSRPVSRDFSMASTMSLNEILDSSTEGEMALDDDFFSDWSSVCISPQKRIDRLTGQTIYNNALVPRGQSSKHRNSHSRSHSVSSSSPESSNMSAPVESSTVIRKGDQIRGTSTGKQKAEPIYDTPYVPKTVPSPVISKMISQQAVTGNLVENSPSTMTSSSRAGTTQVTAEVHADNLFHPSPSLSPNPSQFSQDQGYVSKGSYSQSSHSPSPSLSHRGTPPWLHSTKDPHSFSRNELLTLVINREALTSSPQAIPSAGSPGDSPRLTRPGKLILVPEDKNYNFQGFSSVSSTSSEDKSPIKMFESRQSEDMKSSVIEMKKDDQTTSAAGSAGDCNQGGKVALPESPTSPNQNRVPPPVAKKPVKAVKPEARNPPKDASANASDKHSKIPNPNNNNNNVTVGFLLHDQTFPVHQSQAMDFLVSSMIKEVKSQVFKQHPELGNPFQTKICQSSDSSFENLRVERSGSKDDGYSTMSSDIHPEIMEKFCDTLTWKLSESDADVVSNKSASLKMTSDIPFLKERRNSDSVINNKDRSMDLISDQDSAMDSSLHSTAEMATSSSSQVSNSSTDVTSPSSTNVSKLARLFDSPMGKSNSSQACKLADASAQPSPIKSPGSPKASCYQQPESPRRLANEFQKTPGSQPAGCVRKKSQIASPMPIVKQNKQNQQCQKRPVSESEKGTNESQIRGIPIFSPSKKQESKPKLNKSREEIKEKSNLDVASEEKLMSKSQAKFETSASKNSNRTMAQDQNSTVKKLNRSSECLQKNDSSKSKGNSSATKNSTSHASSSPRDRKSLANSSNIPSPASSLNRQKKNEKKSKNDKTTSENTGSENQGKGQTKQTKSNGGHCDRIPSISNAKGKEGVDCNKKDNGPTITTISSTVKKKVNSKTVKSKNSSTSAASQDNSEDTHNLGKMTPSSSSQKKKCADSNPEASAKKQFIVLTNECFQMVSSDSDEDGHVVKQQYVTLSSHSVCSENQTAPKELSVCPEQQRNNENSPYPTMSVSTSSRDASSRANVVSSLAAASNNEGVTTQISHSNNDSPSSSLHPITSSSTSSCSTHHPPQQTCFIHGSQNQHFPTAFMHESSSSSSSSNSEFTPEAFIHQRCKDNDIPCLWRSKSEQSVLGSRPKSTSFLDDLYHQAWDSGKLLERSTSDSEIESIAERLQAKDHSQCRSGDVFHLKCLSSVATQNTNFEQNFNKGAQSQQSHYFHRFHGLHNVYRLNHQRIDAYQPVTHSLRLDLSDVTELDEESSELASTRDSIDTSNGQITSDESPRLIADEQKQFNSQFYSLCQMGSSKSLLSSSYGSREKLSHSSLNDIQGNNKSFERESDGSLQDCGQLNPEDQIAIKEFDEISRQIASLSKTVDELNHSLSSLNSGEFEATSKEKDSTTYGNASAKVNVIDGYYWVDDEIYLTSSTGEVIKGGQDAGCESFADVLSASAQDSSFDWNSTEDARDEFCRVPVPQHQGLSQVGGRKVSTASNGSPQSGASQLRRWESDGNLNSGPSSKDLQDQRLSVPVFWKSSDQVASETDRSDDQCSARRIEAGDKFHSSMGSNNESDDSLASDIGLDHMMCQRLIGPKGRISHSSTRPVVDLSTFFQRYEESEQEAIAAFDFLDNVTSSGLQASESNMADNPTHGRCEKEDSEKFPSQQALSSNVIDNGTSEDKMCTSGHNKENSSDNSDKPAAKEMRDVGVDAMSRSQASLTDSFESFAGGANESCSINASSSSSLSLSVANQSITEYSEEVRSLHANYCNTRLVGGAIVEEMNIVSYGGCVASSNASISIERQGSTEMDEADVTSYSEFVADLKMHALKDSSPPDLPPRCPIKNNDSSSSITNQLQSLPLPPPPPPPPLPQRSYAQRPNSNVHSAIPRRSHFEAPPPAPPPPPHHPHHHHHTYHPPASPGQRKFGHARRNSHAPYVNQTVPRLLPSHDDKINQRPLSEPFPAPLHHAGRNPPRQPEISHTQDGRPQVIIRPQRVHQEVRQTSSRPNSFSQFPVSQGHKSGPKTVPGHNDHNVSNDSFKRAAKVKDKDHDNSLSKIPKRKLRSRRERSLRKKSSSSQLTAEGGSLSNVGGGDGLGDTSHSWRDISADNGLPLTDSSGADNSSS